MSTEMFKLYNKQKTSIIAKAERIIGIWRDCSMELDAPCLVALRFLQSRAQSERWTTYDDECSCFANNNIITDFLARLVETY